MKRYGRLAAALIGLLLTAGLLFVLETQVQGVSIAPPTFSDTVGIGKIVYATQPTNPTHAYGLALGDIDGDGDLDLLTGSDAAASAELLVWKNPLTNTNPFSATGWISNPVGTTPDHANVVAAVDLDHDGDLDAVSANHDGGGAQIRVWQNDGTPFTGLWTVNTIVGTMHDNIVRALIVKDLDKDGDMDVVASSDNAGTGAEVMAWRNPWDGGTGNPFGGMWTAQDVGELGVDVYSLSADDLDRDGDLDVVCGTQASGSGLLVTWKNPWNGASGDPFASSWNSHTLGTTPSTDHLLDIAIEDMDRDGDLDVATVETVGSPRSGVLRLWENDGTPFTGTWMNTTLVHPASPDPPTDYLGQVAIVDLDHDGDLDVVTGVGGTTLAESQEDDEVVAWLNLGTPFSSDWTRLSVGDAGNGTTGDLAVGDLDNDGDVDIVTVNALWSEYQVTAWANDLPPNRGDYTGGDFTLGVADSAVYGIAAGDLDRDGDPDLVSDGVVAWENPGMSTFPSSWISATLGANTRAQDVAMGDMDHDGDLDVIAGGDFGLALWQNPWDEGSGAPFGTWTVSQVLTTAQIVNAVTVADLDHDGWLDVAAVRGYDAGTGWLCTWQNPHTFTGPWSSNVLTSAAGIRSVTAGDVDRDGWIDLATGSGTYAAALEIRAWRNDHSPFTGDWDSQQVVDVWGTLGGDDVNSIALADLDNDGWLDVVAGYEELTWGGLGTWRNPGTPFSASWPMSVTMSTGSRVWRVAAGDLDHDGDPDVVSAAFPGGNEVHWWQNDGHPFDGSWRSTRATGPGPYDLLLADLNGDGDMDTVVSGQKASGGGEITTWLALWQRLYLPLIVRIS